MPSKSRARCKARSASLPTPSVSRKLTKKPAASRAAKPKSGRVGPAKEAAVKKPAYKAVQLPFNPSLQTEECVGSKLASPPPREAWEAWAATPPGEDSVRWAEEAVYWAETFLTFPTSVRKSIEPKEEDRPYVDALKKIVDDGKAISLEASPLVHQLILGELRLKLGIAAKQDDLLQAGLLSMVEGLDVLLDGEGTPHKKYLALFPKLVACWVRCFLLIKRLKVALPELPTQQQEALDQCKWLALRLAQFARGDGTPMFFGGEKISTSQIEHALKLWSDKADRRNTASLRTDIVRPTPKPAVEKIARAVGGDWSGIGIYRTAPAPDASYLAVAFDDASFQVELGAKMTPLLSGEAKLGLARDGHSIAPTGPWEEVCRHQEPEVEYWELERTFERGVWMQRQVVLASKDRLAYICDNVVADGVGHLTYSLDVPFADGVSICAAEETREIFLTAGKMQSVILPLAAEEWRTTPSYFDCKAENGSLRLTGEAKGQRMAIAWVVDLRGGRKIEELTWRQLRVGENLQNLPRDVAVAYRWQLGKEQWIAYRSLAAPSNRTVLGQNLVGDFLIARLLPTGKVKNIVEIE